MSVVSAKLDNVTLKGNRRRNFIAVQRSVPGSDIAYKLGPVMVDPSATARRLGKKCDYAPPAPTGVPLYSLQRGTDLVYASTPDYPSRPKVMPPPMRGATFDYDSLVAQLDIPFDTPIDYAMGIRPGKRLLKVQEPPLEVPALLFRSGK
jgi:hypothetical protein